MARKRFLALWLSFAMVFTMFGFVPIGMADEAPDPQPSSCENTPPAPQPSSGENTPSAPEAPAAESAEDPAVPQPATEGAIAGDGYSFNPATGELTITSNEGATAWRGGGISKNAVIALTMTGGDTIPGYAFSSCANLTSVALPDTLAEIKSDAFAFCENLASVLLPASLQRVETHAFTGCAKLAAIEVDPGNAAFASEDGILYSRQNNAKTVLVCPEGKRGAVSVSPGTAKIDPYAFYNCVGMTSVALPASLQEIGMMSFEHCTGLTSIDIPAAVKDIDPDAFRECTNLAAINVEQGNTGYESVDGLLYDTAPKDLIICPAGISGDITLPEGLNIITLHAFWSCAGLTSLTLPASLQFVDPKAFGHASNLVSITVNEGNAAYASQDGLLYDKAKATLLCCPKGVSGDLALPDGLQSLPDGAFFRCMNLTSVAVPASVQTIGPWAFENTTNLAAINVSEGNTAYASQDGVLYDKAKSTLLLCPQAKSGAVAIPEGVARIAENAFFQCSGLTSVDLPAGLVSIGECAFMDCAGLASLSLPASVQSVGYLAFVGCDGLAAINVEEGNRFFESLDGVLYTKGKGTLVAFPAVKGGSFVVPSEVTEILDFAFANSRNLTSVTFPAGLQTVGDRAFDNSKVKEIVFLGDTPPSSLAGSAFSNVNSESALLLYIPEGSDASYEATLGSMSGWFALKHLFAVTASAGAGGSITPAGTVQVKEGAAQLFAIAPAEGYRIADVLVDGQSVGAVETYEFPAVTTGHTIAASFAETPRTPVEETPEAELPGTGNTGSTLASTGDPLSAWPAALLTLAALATCAAAAARKNLRSK